MSTLDNEPCVFCKRPRTEHGTPQDMLDYNTNPPTATGRMGQLCPVEGVTSQFWTPALAMHGPRWQESRTLRNFQDEIFDVTIEQSGRNEPFADMRIATSVITFSVPGISPESLEQIADLLNRAADMTRMCSP